VFVLVADKLETVVVRGLLDYLRKRTREEASPDDLNCNPADLYI